LIQPFYEVEFTWISQNVRRQSLARYPVAFQLGVASGGHYQGVRIGAPCPSEELSGLRPGFGCYCATVYDIDVRVLTKRHQPVAGLFKDFEKM
jgi:hypothetical protein